MKRILTIAGSDSGGGAGIQADLKTITVLGGYAMSVVTALTAQNSTGVQGIQRVPPAFIRLQLESVLSDFGVDAAKTGMLFDSATIRTVATMIRRYQIQRLVVDPVMVAKSGDSLLIERAREAIRTDLLPLAHLVTPNLPEASVLCGFEVKDMDTMRAAARRIHRMGPALVLVKGGHLEGPAVDILFDGNTFHTFQSPRLSNPNTHGTGCTYSAALATLLAQGREPLQAVTEAKKFITRAIAYGIEMGSGIGPTNHYASIAVLHHRQETLTALEHALERLADEPIGHLIPEVRSNLAYALPTAMDHRDVAAVPGRITQAGHRLIVCRQPRFGASRHMAKVVLAAMRCHAGMRSAMNIRYSKSILQACRRVGFRIASFDRRQEPQEIKRKEGSSLEWGTLLALRDSGSMVDVIYDLGETGKEPMIRVLAAHPREVVQKVLQVAAALATASRSPRIEANSG